MEVPVINRLGEFDGVIGCALQNPTTFLSRLLSIPGGIDKIPQAYSFWKWGALLLAFLATFTSIFNRIRFFLIRFHSHVYPVSKPLVGHSEQEEDDDDWTTDDDDDDEVDDDDDDDASSSFSFEEEDDDEREDENVENSQSDYDDYRVAGAGGSDRFDDNNRWQNGRFKLRRRRSSSGSGGGGDHFSWSDFASGKSVVKLWDGLGLGFDLNNSSGSHVLSIYDLNKEQKISSIFGSRCQIPAVFASSPSVILSAGVESSRNLALKVWDHRVGCQIPAMLAEWRPVRGKVVGIDSTGVEKVYVRDDVSGELTVRDMRNVHSQLENVKESDGDTWWDADAVMVSNECVDDEAAGYVRESVGSRSRCRDAVWPYLF